MAKTCIWLWLCVHVMLSWWIKCIFLLVYISNVFVFIWRNVYFCFCEYLNRVFVMWTQFNTAKTRNDAFHCWPNFCLNFCVELISFPDIYKGRLIHLFSCYYSPFAVSAFAELHKTCKWNNTVWTKYKQTFEKIHSILHRKSWFHV